MDSDRSEAAVVKPPFSIRENPERREQFFALQTGVPAGLRPLLRAWAVNMYLDSERDALDFTKLTELELLIDRQITPDKKHAHGT